ncbi:Actin-Like Protein 8 [Manis pentadactyla]|nr:Actin-Like Protein 8 [Manis pentadactyla]
MHVHGKKTEPGAALVLSGLGIFLGYNFTIIPKIHQASQWTSNGGKFVFVGDQLRADLHQISIAPPGLAALADLKFYFDISYIQKVKDIQLTIQAE